ncbi:ABC transporter substrate-binding protein [Bradyrhizobium jicamae]|uniref:ABC transporter substrate-binding protein n=1 Tax=Bradyrhizobium jicamae TaxID=280332 RepID=UPI001BA9439F|nr:ABC transporter substrate-binding protein [Bradyrhizobium jicamae]MBR0937416.1 ABC transporter substrate-binding protein [Bradyrhizobium jicamae]
MNRRELIALVGGAAAWPVTARAQLTQKIARIGIVSIGGSTADMMGPLPPNRTVRAFLRGMAELGYVYGRDFVTEPRGTDGIATVAELAAIHVDVIVATGGGTALSVLKQATTTIPIVMTAASDPVRQGFVQSFARPGGNFTGMSMQTLDLTGKRLELLKELVPAAEVVAVLWDSTDSDLWPTASAVGQARGWKLLSVEIRDVTEITAAFKTMLNASASALLVPASGLLFSQASKIVELTTLNRIPAMYELRAFVDVGGLASFGADIDDIWRRAATYVDKILKGASPAELPIEQPTKFELVINKRTAAALGLTMPPSILIQADEVID